MLQRKRREEREERREKEEEINYRGVEYCILLRERGGKREERREKGEEMREKEELKREGRREKKEVGICLPFDHLKASREQEKVTTKGLEAQK